MRGFFSMNDITKTQNLPFATDEECLELRQRFVRAGKIVPAKVDTTILVISGEDGFIPITTMRRKNIADIPEEGVYKVRRIKNSEEYEHRKSNYFTMLQSILRTREELHLEFGEEDETEEISD
jgi:hypothetical protein